MDEFNIRVKIHVGTILDRNGEALAGRDRRRVVQDARNTGAFDDAVEEAMSRGFEAEAHVFDEDDQWQYDLPFTLTVAGRSS